MDAKVHRICFKMEEIIVNNRPDVVVYEKPFSPNNDSLMKLNWGIGSIRTLAYITQTDIEEYTPGHIKKQTTGDGRASKEEVQEAMIDKFGLDKELQKDVADALATAKTYVTHI